VVGEFNVPQNGSFVLAGNHTSYFDCLFLIAVIKRPVHFLGKHTLFKGVKGPIFRGMGVIPVDRTKSHNHEALEEAERQLKNGEIVGVFPEATINRTEDVILPFKIGAVKMAHDTNSPLVPFIITGKYKPFRKSIKIEFCKPITLRNDLEISNKLLMDTVTKKLQGECR